MMSAAVAAGDDPTLHLCGQAALLDDHGLEARIAFERPARAAVATLAAARGVALPTLGYAAPLPDGRCLRLYAACLAPSETPATGLQRWQLSVGTCRITAQPHDEHRLPLTWHWWRRTAAGRLLGEFSLSGYAGAGVLPCQLTWSAWQQPTPTGDDAVHIAEPDPTWEAAFSSMAARIRRTCPAVTRIAHYGSTAVPGLPAKPVVDMLLAVDDLTTARQQLLPVFDGSEWEASWYAEHLVFIRRDPATGTRTHHLHIAPEHHGVWQGLRFRDHLRRHRADAQRYAALKRRLAQALGHDREAYTAAKAAFIAEIMEKTAPAGPPVS